MIYENLPYIYSLGKLKQSWLIAHSNNHLTALKFWQRFQYFFNISFPCSHTFIIGFGLEALATNLIHPSDNSSEVFPSKTVSKYSLKS
jgi:hypothetical protein